MCGSSVSDSLPLPRRVVVTAGALEGVTKVGVAYANQDRPQQPVRLGVPERRYGPRRVADQDGLFVCTQGFDVRQPDLRPRFDVVREGLVDDVQAQGGQLALQPREPDVARREATVAVDQDRFDRAHTCRQQYQR